MEAKICGVKDSETLNYIVNHKYPPKFIGFITNYKKSKRYVEYNELKKLINVKKKGINFVSVLVDPDDHILEKIQDLNFDFYQLYDVTPEKVKLIKNKYNKKIISAITIENKLDVEKYKNFELFSDIILFFIRNKLMIISVTLAGVISLILFQKLKPAYFQTTAIATSGVSAYERFEDEDIIIYEIGGTVGDIESLPF